RARLTLASVTVAAALAADCRPPKPSPALPSFPAEAAVDCFVPTTDDYSVTIVVPDTAFSDSAYLRPILAEIARNWPVTLPLPRLSLDVAVDFYRDGTSTEPRITRSSHVREFNTRALNAVRAAVTDTLWPISSVYPHDTLRTLVRFGPPDANRALVQTWYSVARPPKPRRDNPQPDYPADRRAGQQVIAAFTVDTLGVVDSASIIILSSTDEDYAAAVLAVLPRWRFSPSTVRGCKVARTIRWEFSGKE
ncbi:MAG TPA: TonB family protein, partial [Gemmatimonadaceae bacterium]|nr:TonB family protein [Gemmatimonadaceae bacterium]